MQRFIPEKPKVEDELLDDFNDELEAMRGEDSSNEEIKEEEKEEQVKYFDDKFKRQLEEYRERKYI
jgi:hypothetical protein